MREHARVTWIVHERPWEVEPEIVRRLRVPLNITHNAHDAFTPALKSLRRDAKRRAAHLASQAG
jgi:hypothetical protein